MIIPKSQGRISSNPTLQQHTPMTGLADLGHSIDAALDGRAQLEKTEAKVKLDDVLTKELSEQVTLLKNDVANGAMKAEDADKKLNEWSETRYKELEPDLPEHARKDLRTHWTSNVARNSTSFLPLQLGADRQKGYVIADEAILNATRMNREDGRNYLERTLHGLNLPVADVQEKLNKYETTSDLLDIKRRMDTAVESKDTTILHDLMKEMDEGGFKHVDGPTLQNQRSAVVGRIQAIDYQKQVEENKRVQLAGKKVNEFIDQVMTGRDLDDDYTNGIESEVKGTEHEAEFQFFKIHKNRIQKFAHLSTPEMERELNNERARRANSKTSDAVTEEKLFNVYEKLYNQKKQTIKENPNQAVREAGIETHQLTGTELKTNPGSFADKAIENAVSQYALKDPNLKVRPIPSEDLAEVKQAFDGLSVNQKLSTIGAFITKTKGVPNGEKIWRAALEQIGGGDRTYLLAGVAKAQNRKINNDDLASTLINGKYLVEKGGFVLPNDLETTFRTRYGNLSNYGTYADDLLQFKYAYAVIANRDGHQHAKKDDSPDTTSMNKAFELATGGVYVQEPDSWFGSFKTSGGGSFRNWKVPKPYGMTDERFEAHLEKGYAGLSKMSGYSVSELKDLRLAPRIDRNSNTVMYNLLNERGLPLRSKDGKKTQFIILDGVTR